MGCLRKSFVDLLVVGNPCERRGRLPLFLYG